MMQSSVRTHGYHTVTVTAPHAFLVDVASVIIEWASQIELEIVHASFEFPPEADPIYRITVPAVDVDGDHVPIEFMLLLILDVAHRASLPEPKVSSSTTWHLNELVHGVHATDLITAELLDIGSYEFVYTMPSWYPLDLFDYVATRVMSDVLGTEAESDGFKGWNSEWIWMPDGYAIQLTIYGRPPLDELAFERALAAALTETTHAPYVAGWLAENYDDDEEDDDADNQN